MNHNTHVQSTPSYYGLACLGETVTRKRLLMGESLCILIIVHLGTILSSYCNAGAVKLEDSRETLQRDFMLLCK